MTTKTELADRIDKFLETQIPASPGGGWAKVSGTEMVELYDIFYSIIALKYERDCDGDLPVEFDLIDRNKHERNPFSPVPYSHKDMEGAFEASLTNLGIASDRVNQLIRLRRCSKKGA